VYLFPGTSGTVFVMNTNPISGTGGFHPEALYEFKLDTDGDAVEDITLRVTFGPVGADGGQSIELSLLDGPDARDRHASGSVLLQGQVGEELSRSDGLRLWSGLAGDPFYIEGTVVTAVKKAVAESVPLDLAGFEPVAAANAFAGTNVSAIVLEVPDGILGAGSIGFWGVTALATDAGGWRQINRCAQPLINTIFNPDDSERANEYNASQPAEDRKLYGTLVTELTAAAVKAMGTTADPGEHGRLVCDTLFPDMLRYDVGTAANFGFARRNGRGLTEPAPEVMFSMVLNTAVPMGLSGDSATGERRSEFPYLAPPLTAD
jgi:hypothetical protein